MRKSLILAIALLSLPIFAQNCESIISDDAGMLAGKSDQVLQAAHALVNQGADVRVRTFTSSGGNLDIIEKLQEKSCPSWQNASGGRKSTLLVLMVSKDRKLGVYYGSAWSGALDQHWNRIKSDYMVPRFRDGDYAGGFVAAEEQFAKRLAAAKDESLKPAVSQTVNQASDLHGLWAVFWGILSILVGIGIVLLFMKRSRKREEISDAQSKAIALRNQVASTINKMRGDIAAKIAVEPSTNLTSLRDVIDVAAEDFSRLAESSKTNPDTEGLTAGEYTDIAAQYMSIKQSLSRAYAEAFLSRSVKNDSGVKSTESTASTKSVASTESSASKQSETPAASMPGPRPVSTFPAPTQTIYVQEPVTPLYTPPIVILDREEPYYAPSHHEPERESYTPPAREESYGGGSSSWSSSDSDSGGSSSFDSGSFDSGDGSSDF